MADITLCETCFPGSAEEYPVANVFRPCAQCGTKTQRRHWYVRDPRTKEATMADQDLIERFARECGVWSYPGARIGDSDGFNAGLRRFAALVAGECDAQLRNTSVLYSDPLQSAAARDAGNAIRLKFGAGELGAMAGDHPRQVQGADVLLIMTLPCQTSGWIGWEVWESDPAGPIRLDGEFTAEELERVTRQMREAATSATAQWSCSGSTDGLEEAPCTQMESLKNRRV